MRSGRHKIDPLDTDSVDEPEPAPLCFHSEAFSHYLYEVEINLGRYNDLSIQLFFFVAFLVLTCWALGDGRSKRELELGLKTAISDELAAVSSLEDMHDVITSTIMPIPDKDSSDGLGAGHILSSSTYMDWMSFEFSYGRPQACLWSDSNHLAANYTNYALKLKESGTVCHDTVTYLRYHINLGAPAVFALLSRTDIDIYALTKEVLCEVKNGDIATSSDALDLWTLMFTAHHHAPQPKMGNSTGARNITGGRRRRLAKAASTSSSSSSSSTSGDDTAADDDDDDDSISSSSSSTVETNTIAMMGALENNCGQENMIDISYSMFAVSINSASFAYFEGNADFGFGGGHVHSSVTAPVSVGKQIEDPAYGLFFSIMFVYFTCEAIIELGELFEAFHHRSMYNAFKKYFLDGFNILDLGFLGSFVSAFYSYLNVRVIYSRLNTIEWRKCDDFIHYCYEDKEIYNNLIEVFYHQIPTNISWLSVWVTNLTGCWAFMAIALSIRTFKYFDVHPKLHIISKTLFGTGKKLIYFAFSFLLVSVGYAFGGWMLFRGQLDAFATVGTSFITVLNMCLLGDTDYASMQAINPIAALLYFWSFLGILFLVMLNILLAIIIDEYEALREAQQSGRGYVHFPYIYVWSRVPSVHAHLGRSVYRKARQLYSTLVAPLEPLTSLNGSHAFIHEHLRTHPTIESVDMEQLLACGVRRKVAEEMLQHVSHFLGEDAIFSTGTGTTKGIGVGVEQEKVEVNNVEAGGVNGTAVDLEKTMAAVETTTARQSHSREKLSPIKFET
jgi:hypothetical protein